MDLKKRLAIVVLYSKSSVINKYVYYYLRELKGRCSDIAIIVNGECSSSCIKLLQQEAIFFYKRTNVGYDAGAYKDFFLEYARDIELSVYDELILSNDTFYGPFYSLDNIFKIFDRIDCDYWGITRHPKGKNEMGIRFKSHIQTYFWAIRRSVFLSEAFRQFWNEMDYPRNYWEAVQNYELSINICLEKNKFIGISLMDIYNIESSDNKNPYLWDCSILIEKIRMPFLKKKAINISQPYFLKALNAISYLDKNKLYDTSLIWRDIDQGLNVGFEDIIEFAGCHDFLYVYGNGVYGKNVAAFLKYKNIKFKGYVLSDTMVKKAECISINDLHLKAKDGIIISMRKEWATEVYEKLLDMNIERNQILVGL